MDRVTMLKHKQLLIVGGAGREVGKTEFICRLITKISSQHPVYALKVSAVYPGEELYHGTHSGDKSNQSLFEEMKMTTKKDTSRMLRAGARKVFYMRSDAERIKTGYTEFLKKIPEKALVVCESNSLGLFVKPALSIVVKSVNGQIKPRAIAHMERANLVVVSDGNSGFPELELICFSESGEWEIQSNHIH